MLIPDPMALLDLQRHGRWTSTSSVFYRAASRQVFFHWRPWRIYAHMRIGVLQLAKAGQDVDRN